MSKSITLIVASLLAAGFVSSHAYADCGAMAAEKKLAGAAKTSFMKKCEADAAPAAAAAGSGCAAKAVGKNGKPLAGAAKDAFMKKCEKDAAAAK